MKPASALLRWIRHVLPGMMGDFSVSPTDGKARIYRSGVQVLEDQGNRGAANGYAPLGPSSLVAYGYLGTGGTGAGTRFLADDGTWKAGGGGGGTFDHAALTSNLAWSTSGHTGTANRFAVFNGAGAAAELAMPGTGLVAWTGSAWSTPTLSGMTLAAGTLGVTYGTTAGTSCQGNDSRLSDARTPTAHHASHQHGGSDEVGTATPAANAIPKANGAGVLDAWISAASSTVAGLLKLGASGGAQAWAAILDAIMALGTAGMIVRTGAGTVAARTITAGAGMSVTNGDGVAGNPTIAASSGVASGAAVGISAMCGNGSQGSVTFDGTTAVTGYTISTVGGVKVYTANAGYEHLWNVVTIDTTTYNLQIIPAGNIIRARSILGLGTGVCSISWNGSAASSSTAGAGAAQANSGCPLQGGGNGANGRTTAGVGTAAAALSVGVAMGGNNSTGAGGQGGGNAAGAGGGLTRDWSPGNAVYGSLNYLCRFFDYVGNTIYRRSGGAGGGSGSVSIGPATSGGGGGGAGNIAVYAGSISLGSVTLYIQANGGTGGNATAASNCAGGGQGGAGGGIELVAGDISGTIIIEAKGGNGGNGAAATSTGGGGGGGAGGNVTVSYVSGTAPTAVVTAGSPGTSVGGSPGASGPAGTSTILVL